jgi:type I restriction enzyme S subunit
MKASDARQAGMIPTHWQAKRLKHLGRFQAGAGFPTDLQDNADQEIPFLKVKDIGGCLAAGSLNDVEHTITRETARHLRAEVLPAGCLVFAKIGAALLLNRFVQLPAPACIDNNMMAFVPHRTVNQKFARYAFNTVDFALIANPGAVPSISESSLGVCEIALPPLDEQHTIAAFLDRETARIDALVAAKRRLIALLQEKRAALIARAVTRGLDPEVPTKDSGVAWLGRVPTHWDVTPLKRVTSLIRSGKTPLGGATVYEDEGVPFLRSQNVHFSGLELSDVAFIDIDTHRSMSSSSVLPHDVLLNITGASVGRVCVVPASLQQANVNQHVCIIRLERDMALSEFVATVLQSSGIQAQIRADETGSSREGLTFSQIGDFAIALPPLEEQRAVVTSMARELARLAQSTEIAEQTMQRLTEYRSTLITSAVTGRIDVRTA